MRPALPAERAVPIIALGVGVGAFSMSFWLPFVPLYLKELGATSDANALAWATVAFTGLGIARLVSSPAWGVLSDRFGRKLMFVRALALASATTVIAAAATEPWHVALAFTCQGLLSGFVPAATALTSVSSSEARMGQSLGLVNAGQYVGTTVGPVVGAVLAATFGLDGAILIAGILPAVMAVVVMVLVPRDRVANRSHRVPSSAAHSTPTPRASRLHALAELATPPVRIGLVLSFVTFATSQAQRLAVPLLIAGMVGGSNTAGVVGVAFTIGGVASVVGVVIAGRRLATAGRIVRSLTIATLISAGSYLVLAVSGSIPLFVVAFAVSSMAQAAVLPATNTVIATAVTRDRRGAVFGLAGTAQAFAFMVGPLAATLFATVSYQLGFVLIAVVYLLSAWLVHRRLQEPPRRTVEPIPETVEGVPGT